MVGFADFCFTFKVICDLYILPILPVIAFAYGKDLSNLTYLGLAGIIDPPRRGVHDAIRVLQESGVQVKMITGDAKDTAVAVGQSIGIDVEQRNVISGEQLESMDVYELRRVINEVCIETKKNNSKI